MINFRPILLIPKHVVIFCPAGPYESEGGGFFALDGTSPIKGHYRIRYLGFFRAVGLFNVVLVFWVCLIPVLGLWFVRSFIVKGNLFWALFEVDIVSGTGNVVLLNLLRILLMLNLFRILLILILLLHYDILKLLNLSMELLLIRIYQTFIRYHYRWLLFGYLSYAFHRQRIGGWSRSSKDPIVHFVINQRQKTRHHKFKVAILNIAFRKLLYHFIPFLYPKILLLNLPFNFIIKKCQKCLHFDLILFFTFKFLILFQ